MSEFDFEKSWHGEKSAYRLESMSEDCIELRECFLDHVGAVVQVPDYVEGLLGMPIDAMEAKRSLFHEVIKQNMEVDLQKRVDLLDIEVHVSGEGIVIPMLDDEIDSGSYSFFLAPDCYLQGVTCRFEPMRFLSKEEITKWLQMKEADPGCNDDGIQLICGDSLGVVLRDVVMYDQEGSIQFILAQALLSFIDDNLIYKKVIRPNQ